MILEEVIFAFKISSLAGIRGQLNSFNPKKTQKDIKAVPKVRVNAEPQKPNDEVPADMKQDISVGLLYIN